MKIIKGNLILEKDTEFLESIEVEGDIRGYYNLKVAGKINAGNIDAWDINAGDINAGDINAGKINAWDINAGKINAWDINAGDINAGNIVCEKRIKKNINAKTLCRVFIQNRSKLEKKEQMPEDEVKT